MNPLLSDAIRIYDERGEQFADLIPWHTVNGIVVMDHECIMLGYLCRVENVREPAEPSSSNCLFVSYYGGDMGKLTSTYGHLEFIAYERIRDRSKLRIHRMRDLLKHITR